MGLKYMDTAMWVDLFSKTLKVHGQYDFLILRSSCNKKFQDCHCGGHISNLKGPDFYIGTSRRLNESNNKIPSQYDFPFLRGNVNKIFQNGIWNWVALNFKW